MCALAGACIKFGSSGLLTISLFDLVKLCVRTFRMNLSLKQWYYLLSFMHTVYHSFKLPFVNFFFCFCFCFPPDWIRVRNIGIALGKFAAWKNLRLGRTGNCTGGITDNVTVVIMLIVRIMRVPPALCMIFGEICVFDL